MPQQSQIFSPMMLQAFHFLRFQFCSKKKASTESTPKSNPKSTPKSAPKSQAKKRLGINSTKGTKETTPVNKKAIQKAMTTEPGAALQKILQKKAKK
eukprot:m.66557 g.66557  ORF g.66557 m.66557 type:complete len:97 (+) comp11816_c0_seq2:453-743(+)